MAYVFKGYSVVTECITETCEESKRNRPYFQDIISEHVAIEKNTCKRKKLIAHAGESDFFRKSHQTWRCNVYYLKSCACFSQGGVYMTPLPRLDRVTKRHSVDMCIYVLKEMIEYFKSRNTSVFVIFWMHQKLMTKLIIGNCLTNY